MPIHQGYGQHNGKRMGFYQWGSQKKYWYIPGNETSRKRAKTRAQKQAAAIYSSGYSGS